MAAEPTGSRPPALFWVLPAAIALLRTLPYLWSVVLDPPEGMAVLQVGYNPRDVLSYLSFIRQLADDGAWLWYNPFTTEPHEPRFILLFHAVLGGVAWLTRVTPTVVLECSRIPLTFLFFWVLWWFLRPIVPDRTTRVVTCVLVGLSGGIEGFVRLFLSDLPVSLNPALIAQSTWPLFGWSTFQAFYNPLWIVALTLTLVVLRPLLNPDGPRGPRDYLLIALGSLVLYWSHPYSGIVVLAVVAARPAVDWIFERRPDWAAYGRIAAALAPVIVLVAAVTRWQASDAVYRAASGNVFGSLATPVFWYPLTLGAVGVLAIRGGRGWVRDRHPYLLPVLSWLAAVVLLHTSPILNGFHFVFHLHLALCVLAAPAARRLFARLGRDRGGARVWAGVWMVALFAGFALVTAESLADVRERHLVPESYSAVVAALAREPTGHVLAPPALGNVIPAYTSHRVWVGHWFLTPDYSRKAARYARLVSDPTLAGELRQVVANQHIDYLVVPRERGDAMEVGLGSLVDRRVAHGSLDLLVIRQSSRAP